MAKKFHEGANRGEELGLTEDEIRVYSALASNESAVRELKDETLKKIARELTENLRQNLSVDWSERESVRVKLRLMGKRILRTNTCLICGMRLSNWFLRRPKRLVRLGMFRVFIPIGALIVDRFAWNGALLPSGQRQR
jgi:hypothetical protein